MKVVFLGLEDVLALHASRIERYGGTRGVRNLGLLESALATPAATFGGAFLHPTLPEMAAAYLFHLVKNHPFLDGNKRTGLAAMLVFLGLNGLDLVAEEDHLADVVLGVAAGTTSKAEVAVFIESHTVPCKLPSVSSRVPRKANGMGPSVRRPENSTPSSRSTTSAALEAWRPTRKRRRTR